MFGYAATFEVFNVSMAAPDHDHSQESREFMSRFEFSERFQIVREAASACDIAGLIDEGTTLIAIEIAPGFAENLRKGQEAQVEVDIDGANSNTALIAMGYVGHIAAKFFADYAGDRADRVLGGVRVRRRRSPLSSAPGTIPASTAASFSYPA